MEQQKSQYQQRVIMLDLSLFVLDFLDPDKISQKFELSNDIFEVPSALVLMMRDSKSGSPILFLFIYSFLKKIQKSYLKKSVNSKRLAELIHATEEQVKNMALEAEERFFDKFSPLIDQNLSNNKTAEKDYSQQDQQGHEFIYPIRRYDEIGTLTPVEQSQLQKIYTEKLELPRHNLFDLYFAQIYHAQTQDTPNKYHNWERVVSLGEETFNIISKWKEVIKLHEGVEEDKKLIQESREFITEFKSTYLKEHHDDIVFGAKYELPIALILGGPAGAGASLITMTGGTIIKAINASSLKEEYKKILIAIVVIVVLLSSALLLGIQGWEFLFPQSTTTPIPAPTATLTFTSVPQIANSPTPIPTAIPATITLVPPTPYPSPPATTFYNRNYCLYVTQLGDTAQSISKWFEISEDNYRNTNNSHPGTEFTEHHLVTINAPCCNSQYSNGISYTVRHGDTIFSLAKTRSITPEYLATANRLRDPWYIQVGQMLCLP